MRKLGFGIIGLAIVGAIYYFTVGSTQVTEEMKKQVNNELTTLQQNGFGVKDRETKETEEYFVLSFDDPKKVANFLIRQGVQLDVNDAELFKGLKIAVDVSYLTNAYSAVSFDMYPIALPIAITQSAHEGKDKKTLAQVQKMLDKKTFLMHVAVNKFGTGFKGYMKDIDEVLHGEKDLKLSMKGLDFSGDIENDKIHRVKQNLKQFTINVPDELDMKLTSLKSNYVMTGKTLYDYSTDYSIEKMEIDGNSKFNLYADDITMQSVSMVKDGLASGTMTTKTKHINFKTKDKKLAFETFVFDMKADNLNVVAFEKLQQIDANNTQEINILFQELISKGVSISIPTLSIAKIEIEGKKMDGFNLSAKVDIDKSLDIKSLKINPMAALNAIDANLDIALSEDLFTIVAQQPQAIIALMLFQPKDENGKKVYELELKDGSLKVNGMPIM